MKKRDFLKTFAALGMINPFYLAIEKWISDLDGKQLKKLESDEIFWEKIRSGYRLKPDYINLENGYYCIQPEETLKCFLDHIKEVNYLGSYYMRTVQWENKNKAAAALAEMIGAEKEELVVTRNTTESLDSIISGYNWKPGDEAVFATHDYGAMKNQFRLMEKRWGISNKEVDVPLHPKSDEEIVDVYRRAITSKTKLLMICHMINITGQILPVRKICDMAHELGVDVMVDGAHAVAHIDFNIKELDCDYYGSSLHKWLSVPLGAGLLYVKKEKIKDVWPMFAEWGAKDDEIKKLNHTGTHPVHTDLTILDAVYYYQLLGPERKENRLRFLQNYWRDALKDVPGIVINTPEEKHRSCGIANVGIAHMKPSELAKTLLEKYRIWTVAIDSYGVKGCRITPNVYTTVEELDEFIKAMKEMAAS